MNSILGLDSNGQPIDQLLYNEKSKEREEFKDITFVRPNEIFGENYKLFSGKIEFDDVKQGGLGDCYFYLLLQIYVKFLVLFLIFL